MRNLLERSAPYRGKNWRRVRFKSLPGSSLDRLPFLGISTRHIWRITRWRLLEFRDTLEYARARDYALDIDKTYWLSPQMIRYSSLREFDIHRYKGKIIKGNRDRLEKRFEDLDVYVALKEVLVGGREWDQTAFYKRTLTRVKQGEFLWGCKNKSDLEQRCRMIEVLYHRIRNNGYKTQQELSRRYEDSDPMRTDDEITVCVGRYGDLLFSNGAHRLCVAKLLGVRSKRRVPVKIAVRHPQWLNFRKKVLLYAKDYGGKISHPITHLDLSDIPSLHESEKRFQIIRKNLSAKEGRLLDIGPGWGYFCHRFEEEKFHCYTVENDRENLYFLKTLKRAENRNFEIVAKSIFEYEGVTDLCFDVVLALNTSHHFLEKRDAYHKFISLLRKLRLKEMFFEPPLPNKFQMEGAYRDYSNEEFVKLIIQNSNLENAQFIGEAEDGRRIYKLY